jgi:hypothetical protein
MTLTVFFCAKINENLLLQEVIYATEQERKFYLHDHDVFYYGALDEHL